MEMLIAKPVFGIILSIVAYYAGTWIRRKTGSALANPLVIAAILIILLIQLTPIDLAGYQAGGQIIGLFVVPATTVLALQIHRQWALLKANILPVVAGCLAGSVTSIASVWGLCKAFAIDEVLTASLMPKSVTTAIAVELSERAGGLGALTVAAVIITGTVSALLAPVFVKWFKLEDSVSLGAAMGTSGHALATSRAVEYGETEGAMSGIALTLTGIITSLLFTFLL